MRKGREIPPALSLSKNFFDKLLKISELFKSSEIC